MIYIGVTKDLEWSVVYRLEGVKATEVVSKDITVILNEVKAKLRLELGLAKGRSFTNATGREI